MDRDSVRPREDTPTLKKVYITPKLTEYGSVAALTQSAGTTTISDHGGNNMHT